MMILLTARTSAIFRRRESWGWGHQSFDENVLDEPDAGVDVDVFNVEGVQARLAAVHHSMIGVSDP